MARPQTVEDYRGLQDQIYGGRKWIVALDALAVTRGMISQLRDRGALECFAIAASRGTGEAPEADWGPEPVVLDVEAETMMEGIWASLAALANLPADVRARVDAFDPAHEARVIGTIFDDGAPVAGREKFGRRREAWRALEDKVIVDALWEELDVPHAPYEIVAAEAEAMMAAAERLDRGAGTVWAGDAHSGFHGGAEFTRWVRNAEQAAEVAAHFGKWCERARVMPFLEGIPCSIHGIVFPDYVVAGRPCEMLVLRNPETSRLRYATAASFWDPPDAERQKMRELARKVGAHLRQTVDYRGAFTIDGVMTTEGFLPTELNPRFGGALGLLAAGMDLGIFFIDLAVMEGVEVDWNPERLEELLIENADRHRHGHSNVIVTTKTETTERVGLYLSDDGELVVGDDDDDALVHVLRGPATAGTYLRLRYSPHRTPVGPSTAPLTARALRVLDEHWELGIGVLEPAPDVHLPETP